MTSPAPHRSTAASPKTANPEPSSRASRLTGLESQLRAEAPLNPGASFTPDPESFQIRDLAYAAALLEASERLQGQPDFPALLASIVAEAVTLISADAAAVMRYTGIRRDLLDIHIQTQDGDRSLADAIRSAAVDHQLLAPGPFSGPQGTDRTAEREALPWPSVRTTALLSPSRQDQLRLVWFSATPHAFDHQLDVTELFARHVNLAIGTRVEQEHLNRAIAARHHVGQAQGILMARHRLSADQAFARLLRESQQQNVPLHVLADGVIKSGRIPGAPQPGA